MAQDSYAIIEDEFGRRWRVSFQAGRVHTGKLRASLTDRGDT
ncbi:hypothetical protein [Lysobacter sp. CA199]